MQKVIRFMSLLLLLGQFSCGPSASTGGGTPSGTVTASGTDLWAFGDSITNPGADATAGNSWIALLSSALGMTLNNQGASGNGVWMALDRAYVNMADTGNDKMVAILLAYNDMRAGGSDPRNVNMIANAIRALIANSFLSTAVAANNAAVTKSGTYTTFISSSVGGKADRIVSTERGVKMQAAGATLSWDFTGDNCVVGFVGTDGTLKDNGSFEVLIDGVSKGVYDSNDYGSGKTLNSKVHDQVPGALVFTGLSAGSHTVQVVAQADVNSTNVVVIDYFGTMMAPALCKPVVVGQVLKMTATGYATGTVTLGSDAAVDAINTALADMLTAFSSWPVALALTGDYYDPTTTSAGDHVHPNNTGHLQIYNAFDAVIQ